MAKKYELDEKDASFIKRGENIKLDFVYYLPIVHKQAETLELVNLECF